MKILTKHFINLFLGFFLLTSGGCIMEDFVDDGPSTGHVTLTGDTIGYMSLKFQTFDDLTRAAVGDAFEQGDGIDYALASDANHFALFFKKGTDYPIAIADIQGASSQEISTDKNASSSIAFAAIAGRSEIADELRQMLDQLEECIVVLNTDLKAVDMWGITKTKLLSTTIKSPFFRSADGKDYITMSNTVYLDGNQKVTGSKIDPYKIYSSYLEAIEEAWKGNAAVEAYVEHTAAKFRLSFEDEALNREDAVREFVPTNYKNITVFSHLENGIPCYNNGTTGHPYSCKVKITGWGLNATEQEIYLFRNFNPAKNYFANWYDTDFKRAYWSEDVHYTNAKYPWQYRRVIDNSGLTVYQNGNNILRNYSYDELNANKFTSNYLYAPENTYDFNDAAFAKALDNRPELLAGTHIIVCAELLSNIEDSNTFKTEDLFRDRMGNFYKNGKDAFKAFVATINNTLMAHSFLKFTYWDWSNGGVEHKLFASTKGNFNLYWNNTKVTADNADEIYDRLGGNVFADAEFKGGDGKRIFWFDGLTIKDDAGRLMQTYSNIDEVNSNNNVYLRESTIDDIKSVIFEHVGGFEHFSGGKMYYAIPIGYVQNGTNPDGTSKYSVYGVVRNSLYDIVIKGVADLGTAVDISTQPIVPGGSSTQDHLYLDFDIIDWHPINSTVPGLIN